MYYLQHKSGSQWLLYSVVILLRLDKAWDIFVFYPWPMEKNTALAPSPLHFLCFPLCTDVNSLGLVSVYFSTITSKMVYWSVTSFFDRQCFVTVQWQWQPIQEFVTCLKIVCVICRCAYWPLSLPHALYGPTLFVHTSIWGCACPTLETHDTCGSHHAHASTLYLSAL